MQGLRTTALVCASLFGAALAHAAEVHVLVAGAAKAAFEKMATDYERSSGNTLKASYDTVGALRDRVLAGEKVDLVVLSAAAIDSLAQKGLVAGAERNDVGVVISGLAVRRGSPIPDISTEAALKQTLLAAPSIAQADGARGATSGTHFSQLVNTLGLRDALNARIAVLPFGAEAIQGVADGKFALGVSQSSEIVPMPGVVFVGGFPSPYSLRTTYTAAAIGGSAAGRALLTHLQTEPVRGLFAASGFSPP